MSLGGYVVWILGCLIIQTSVAPYWILHCLSIMTDLVCLGGSGSKVFSLPGLGPMGEGDHPGDLGSTSVLWPLYVLPMGPWVLPLFFPLVQDLDLILSVVVDVVVHRAEVVVGVVCIY